jgi:hypothetical protein
MSNCNRGLLYQRRKNISFSAAFLNGSMIRLLAHKCDAVYEREISIQYPDVVLSHCITDTVKAFCKLLIKKTTTNKQK